MGRSVGASGLRASGVVYNYTASGLYQSFGFSLMNLKFRVWCFKALGSHSLWALQHLILLEGLQKSGLEGQSLKADAK